MPSQLSQHQTRTKIYCVDSMKVAWSLGCTLALTHSPQPHLGNEQERKRQFWFFSLRHLLVLKVQLCKIEVRCPHHLQVESPTHLLSLKQKTVFMGPHHISKILGKINQSTTKMTLNEHASSLQF